jgi:hypothetical protein
MHVILASAMAAALNFRIVHQLGSRAVWHSQLKPWSMTCQPSPTGPWLSVELDPSSSVEDIRACIDIVAVLRVLCRWSLHIQELEPLSTFRYF